MLISTLYPHDYEHAKFIFFTVKDRSEKAKKPRERCKSIMLNAAVRQPHRLVKPNKIPHVQTDSAANAVCRQVKQVEYYEKLYLIMKNMPLFSSRV